MFKAIGSGAVRSWKTCAFWLIFTVVSILSLVFLDDYSRQELGLDSRVLSGFVALFSAQAFLAEAIGLRANARGVSFPRRLFPNFGFPTVWRRRIDFKDISRADSRDTKRVRFYLTSAELVDVLFPDTISKQAFLNYVAKELTQSSRQRGIRRRALDPL